MVQMPCEHGYDALQTLLELHLARVFHKEVVECLEVGFEGDLVGGLEKGQVVDQLEEVGSADGGGFEEGAGGLDVEEGFVQFVQGFRDLDGFQVGFFERADQG